MFHSPSYVKEPPVLWTGRLRKSRKRTQNASPERRRLAHYVYCKLKTPDIVKQVKECKSAIRKYKRNVIESLAFGHFGDLVLSSWRQYEKSLLFWSAAGSGSSGPSYFNSVDIPRAAGPVGECCHCHDRGIRLRARAREPLGLDEIEMTLGCKFCLCSPRTVQSTCQLRPWMRFGVLLELDP